MLTKQQHDRNDGTKEPTNEKSTKDRTKPHASTEDRTKNTRRTRRYYITSGRVVHSLSGGPWYHSFANELTYIRIPRLTATIAERVYRWQRGLAHVTWKRSKLLRMVPTKGSYEKYARLSRRHNERNELATYTHGNSTRDGKTMTRRTRQAPIQTETSFTSELSVNTSDSTYHDSPRRTYHTNQR